MWVLLVRHPDPLYNPNTTVIIPVSPVRPVTMMPVVIFSPMFVAIMVLIWISSYRYIEFCGP